MRGMSPAFAASRVSPLVLRERLVADGVLFAAYRCWTGAATGFRLPCRHDIAPLLAPERDAGYGLADVLPALGQFRYRLPGAGLRTLVGAGIEGRIVGAAVDPSPFGALDRAAFLESAFRERVVFSRRRAAGGNGTVWQFDRLVLPLRGAGDSVATLLFAQDCDRPETAPVRGGAPPPAGASTGGGQPVTGPVEEVERLALSWMDCAHEYQRSA